MADLGERVGQQLGNYRLLSLLGKGAFAEVYLGEHVHLGTQAAIKVLYAKVDHDGIEAFRAEARTIASLEHPSIVRVLDFGVEGNTPFLVMSYAPGGTLRMRYPRGTSLPLAAIVSYVQQISSALQYAHERRLVHRDIKPENLLLGRNNEVLLSDFGIALVAQSSHYQHPQDVAGTISYMAPEQIQSYPRPASDQYSLGIVVYEWLGGEVPFKGAFTDVAVKHALMQPPSLLEKIPTLSPVVEQVVFTALAKVPQQRFPTVLAFAGALKQACEPTQQLLQTFPMSYTAPYQSWQSTFVKIPLSQSLQPTTLNSSSATFVPDPSTPIPHPYTSPITSIPTSSITQATFISNPSTFISSSIPHVSASTPTPEAFPPSINVWKRLAHGTFIRCTGFRAVLIAVVCTLIIASFVSAFVRSASSTQQILHPAKLVVDRSLVDFGNVAKGAKAALAIDLSNTGTQPLSCTVDVGKVTWLQVQTLSTTIGPGVHELDNLTITTANLPPGVSSALLTIRSNGGNVQVQVRVEVIDSGQKAAMLTVSTNSLAFGIVTMATQIMPQSILISNVGILGLNWKADVGTARWVVLDKNAGTIQPGGSPQTINVKVQATGLAAGSYTTMMSITSNGGKQSVQVSMMLNSSSTSLSSPTSSSPSTPATSIPQKPQMSLNVSSLNFGSMSAGQSQNMPMVVRNTGGEPLTWQANTGGTSWVTLDMSNGTIQPAMSQTINVTVNTKGFSPGPKSATLSINSNGGNQQVAITLTVTATALWVASASSSPGNSIYSSAAIADGVAYVGSANHNLYAFNASTGATLWVYTTGGPIYSTPAVVNGVVYFGSDDYKLYAVNASAGTLLWSYTTGNYIKSSPIVVNGVLYIGSEDNNLYALNSSSGIRLWMASTGGSIEGSPTVVAGVVYSGSDDDKLYAWNASTGAQLWTATTGSVIHSSPVVSNNVVYIGSNDYKLYAVNASSGAVLWTYTTGSYVGAVPTVVNGVVYIGSGDGKLYALAAS